MPYTLANEVSEHAISIGFYVFTSFNYLLINDYYANRDCRLE